MEQPTAVRTPVADGPATASHSHQDALLRHAIDEAIELLPTQGPITVFVHHNTLHVFEDLPFDEAVRRGLEVYGCEPYLSEQRYRQEIERGRIRMEDIRAVLMEDLGEDAERSVAAIETRYSMRLAMLQHAVQAVPRAEIEWILCQSDALNRFRDDADERWREEMRAFAADSAAVAALVGEKASGRRAAQGELGDQGLGLRMLWALCRQGAQQAARSSSPVAAGIRLRDLLREHTGVDADSLVHDVLIRFCAAFSDQGIASWTLPDHPEGFLASFARLYSLPLVAAPRWMRGVGPEMRRILKDSVSPLESIERSLVAMGYPRSQWPRVIRETLLALRGWAGMLWQLESAPEGARYTLPPGTLVEFLAVRLILDRHAAADVARQALGTDDLARVPEIVATGRKHKRPEGEDPHAWALFQMAQVRGWRPDVLRSMSGSQWRELVDEIDAFSSIERRRILHLAYERQYHTAALDAVMLHAARRHAARSVEGPRPAVPHYQVLCCLDDREESLRRHLEEVDPECETFGAAGFYGVAMNYQGAADAHYRPLCPAVVTPVHYVREEPVFSAVRVGAVRTRRRRLLGRIAHRIHVGSRTLVGGMVTGLLGALASVPLVARVLAPRETARLRTAAGGLVRAPATELKIERTTATPGMEYEALGYTPAEMAGIVLRLLEDVGLVGRLSPLVLLLGHGSSSMNNPHESAYCCGACSGGRGGPNARAFAMMANDRRVRDMLAQRGVVIGDDVWFVGGYHNTCNDHIEYYDLDRVPRSHRDRFRRVEHQLSVACARNAQERSRWFHSVPLDVEPEEALEQVQRRAEDLSEARPEYNHATNALCLVGERWWSRGLFLDRRAFLTSYDPEGDDEERTILTRILQAAVPVCAGISLEYYFSTVDTEGYGCGSKLPQNITSLIGVMTGSASDLRPGLSAQMVEIHEPLRILFIIETSPTAMERILANNPAIARLVYGQWVQLAVFDPASSTMHRWGRDGFEVYRPESESLPEVAGSREWYQGSRETLGFASIVEPPAPSPSHAGGRS